MLVKLMMSCGKRNPFDERKEIPHGFSHESALFLERLSQRACCDYT